MFIYSFAKKKFNLNTDMGIENKNMHIEIVSIEENQNSTADSLVSALKGNI